MNAYDWLGWWKGEGFRCWCSSFRRLRLLLLLLFWKGTIPAVTAGAIIAETMSFSENGQEHLPASMMLSYRPPAVLTHTQRPDQLSIPGACLRRERRRETVAHAQTHTHIKTYTHTRRDHPSWSHSELIRFLSRISSAIYFLPLVCCWCWGWWKSCQPRVQAHCLDWVQPRQRVMPQGGGREQGQKREREPPAVAWPWCGSVESVVVNCADGARQGHCITHVQQQQHQTTSDTVSTRVFCPFLSSCTSSISPLRVTVSRGHATMLLAQEQ